MQEAVQAQREASQDNKVRMASQADGSKDKAAWETCLTMESQMRLSMEKKRR